METSIGNAPWQYKYTKYISKHFPEIEKIAQIHDHLFAIFQKWKLSIFNKIYFKFMFDLIFIIGGLIMMLVYTFHDIFCKKLGLLLFPFYWAYRLLGIIILTQLYIILFVTTFIPPLWDKGNK
ncbi:MAG TPA: hypothetical protein DCL21_00765 [Alphaproteobacteria bacterium]|nr:hypothetical protein [Alphaproteobacteria bacterium]